MLPITTNFSPFCVKVRLTVDAQARQSYVVVLGGSFRVPPTGHLQLDDEQLPIQDTDVARGALGASSIRYEADLAENKLAVDVVVNGQAWAPRGTLASLVPVGIQVGSSLRKLLSVSGDRFWRRTPLGRVPSSPKPFRTMPIVYERALGGSSADFYDATNPVGLGRGSTRSADPEVNSELPNIEHPKNSPQAQQQYPAGYGFIARNWSPRLELAGHYDAQWRTDQFPLLPTDFDARFHQAAPLDQQLTSLADGELVHVVNMTAEGHWRFQVPRLKVPLCWRFADRVEEGSFHLDTLILEPDDYRVVIRARAAVPLQRRRAPLEEVVVGHATPAWWLARVSRKQYRGGPGRNGGMVNMPYWHAE